LEYKDPEVRIGAALTLGNIGDKKAVEPLIKALKDYNWRVQAYAVEALGKIGDTRGVTPLIKRFSGANENVVTNIKKALNRIGKPAVKPILESVKDEKMNFLKDDFIEIIENIGKPAITILNKYVKDNDPRVKYIVTASLKKLEEKTMQQDDEKKKRRNMHVSKFAYKLRCPHCGKIYHTKLWPENGDNVDFNFQKEQGKYNLKIACPECGRYWYIVWKDDPGPIKQLDTYI